MARTAKGGLSKHPKHGFRLTIGKKPDGKPRLFWLGHNRFIAEYHAEALQRRLKFVMKAQGRDVWTPGDEQIISDEVALMKAGVAALNRQQPIDLQTVQLQNRVVAEVIGNTKPQATTPGVQPARQVTLYGAIKTYLETLDGKRISQAHKWRSRQVLDKTLKGIRSDCPLDQIDYLWLDRLCDHFKARPKTAKTGEPMRPETVVTTLRYLRTFFNWIDDSSFGNWEGPRKLVRPFRVRASDLMSSAELREAATIKQFDVATLVKLYQSASDAQKTWMLTALFTGGTQTELSILTKAEFDLDAAKLEHYRNKTKIVGSFWLPPELVTLLRAEFAQHPKKSLAFYTEEGNAILWYQDDHKIGCDSVRLSWDRLRIKAEVPDAPSFKFLRKFAGDFAMRMGGESMGQIALSHARSTVLAKNYSTARDFETFNGIQRQMHEAFKVAGMFDAVVKASKSTKAKAA